MNHEAVLELLARQTGTFVSGEAMSQALGVTRAAIWKSVEALRAQGYPIASKPKRGYALTALPDELCASVVRAQLHGHRIGSEVLYFPSLDSTNDEVKRRAATGAQEGLCVFAGTQEHGRGRRGRDFLSPPGAGLYCSILLRPHCALEELFQLTAWAAVAVCVAIERCTGHSIGIKWTNDLVLEQKKLGGILTELNLELESSAPQALILGIGLNLSQSEADFPPELRTIATSLAQAGASVSKTALAVQMLLALDEMMQVFPQGRDAYLQAYRARCVTLGKPVRILRANGSHSDALALDINDDFSLRVRHTNGAEETIQAGDVSVRGLYGYL